LTIAKKGIGEFWQSPNGELASFGNHQTGNWQVLANFGKFWQILANFGKFWQINLFYWLSLF
jgi:hypothetical protein